jgi:hypothetical protein
MDWVGDTKLIIERVRVRAKLGEKRIKFDGGWGGK